MSALVLLAPHVFVEDVSVASIAEARTTFETTDLGERMARYHRDPERTFRLWNDIWLAPEFRDWNIEDVLAGVTAPTLLIQGEHDQYGTLAQIDAIERGVARTGDPPGARLPARPAPRGAGGDARGRRGVPVVIEDRFAIPFERSFDAHYGLEFLEPTRGRVTVRPELLGAGRDRAQRRLRRDGRVARLHRHRRRGAHAGPDPVRAEQLHARDRRGCATG